MKKLLLLLVVISTVSCVNLNNICKKSIRINGEVMYAVPSKHKTRDVTLQTVNGVVIVYRVPLEQPLTNIPACYKDGKLYWVMP